MSVRAGLPEMNRSMEAIGRRLGLVALAVDCEGHSGHDGNFYIVDTARVMPPEDFRQTGSHGFSMFWRQFPPELLSHLMQRQGEAYLVFFLAVRSWCRMWLESCAPARRPPHGCCRRGYARGVNVRHMGRVRSSVGLLGRGSRRPRS